MTNTMAMAASIAMTMNITMNDSSPNGYPFAFSQLFTLESSDLMENGSYWYSSSHYIDQLKEDIKKNRSKNQDI